MINKRARAQARANKAELSRAEHRTHALRTKDQTLARTHTSVREAKSEHVLVAFVLLKKGQLKLNLLAGNKIISISVRSSFVLSLQEEAKNNPSVHTIFV